MQIDPKGIRSHYASLSDEGLRDIDRSDLTGLAQKYYDEEVARRELLPQEEPEQLEDGAEPEWLGDAACACAYTSFPGSSSAAEAATARDALEDAGIPCYIVIHKLEPDRPPDDEPVRHREYQVMVPGALNLQATSVLDEQIFNVDVEGAWAVHFQALSDEELQALTPEVICAGMEDRIMRLKRAYAAELDRRQLNTAT